MIYTKILAPDSAGTRVDNSTYNDNPEYTVELLKQYLDAAILLIVLGWLTLSNFRHGHQNWKFWLRNFLAILAVFVGVSVLIHFLWEIVQSGVY